MKVTLREKKLKSSKRSLYLDFYPPIIVDGRRAFVREAFLLNAYNFNFEPFFLTSAH